MNRVGQLDFFLLVILAIFGIDNLYCLDARFIDLINWIKETI